MFYPAGEVKLKLFEASSANQLEIAVNSFIAGIENFIFVSFRAKFSQIDGPDGSILYLGELVYSSAIATLSMEDMLEDEDEGYEYPGGFIAKKPRPYVPQVEEEEEREADGTT